jgi:hypothetical protein
VQNNPLKFTDPTGRVLAISGESSADFIEYLKKKSGLSLVADDEGHLQIEGKRDKKKTSGKLAEAIKSAIDAKEEVGIKVEAEPSETLFDNQDTRTVSMSNVKQMDSLAPELGVALTGHVLAEYTSLAKGNDFETVAHPAGLIRECQILSESRGIAEQYRYNPPKDPKNPNMERFIYTNVTYDVLLKSGSKAGSVAIEKVTKKEK